MSCCRLRSAPRRYLLNGADFGLFRMSLLELRMSLAPEQTIDGYIHLNDRGALAELKAHHENLLAQLIAQIGGYFDVSRAAGLMEEEIAQIEAGLARLG